MSLSMPTEHFEGRPTWVRVDLGRIRANVCRLRQQLSGDQKLMAVVKANGYGHGALAVASAAIEAGADWLGVALAEEGAELRQAGITVPILVLGPSHGPQFRIAAAHRLDLMVFAPEHLVAVSAAVAATGTRARLHLKLDTGMGRVGLAPEELNDSWIADLRNPAWDWVGIATHFASSDSESALATRHQLQRFLNAIEFLRLRDALPPEIHAANSAALLRYPGTHFTLVRAGLALYGLRPYRDAAGLVPALRWESRVVYVKTVPAGFAVGYGATYVTDVPMQLAAVPVGYADGYQRIWSNRSSVLIDGVRRPVVGRVSMDQITVAVPMDAVVRVGDRVTLIGEDGAEAISAEELADLSNSIAYEVVSCIGQRVPRIWIAD